MAEGFAERTGHYEEAVFGRVVTAMVTPFDTDGDLNLDAAQELAHYLQNTGSEAIVVAGTTGESPTLSHLEQLAVIEAVHDAVDIPVIAGAGSNNTQEAVELSRAITDSSCAEGLLVVSPYYNRPPQTGIEQYFGAVAASTDLPIVVYDIPVRTGRAIESDTMLRLAEVENIVALKDASGRNPLFTGELIKQLGDSMEVYSGDDALNLRLRVRGAVGAISVASNWAGKEMAQMYDAAAAGDFKTAFSIEEKLRASYVYESSNVTPNPIPAKAMMRYLGIDVGRCRSPMVVPEEFEERLEAQAEQVYLALTAGSQKV